LLPVGPLATIDTSACESMAGGVVSWIVTAKVEVEVLLAESVAVQDTVVVPIAKVEPETGEQVGISSPSTVSIAEAVKLTVAPDELVASVEIFDGTVTIGKSSSATVTVNEALPVLLCTSVAEHVTLVVPIAKVEPETGEQVGVIAPSTVSVADAVKVTTAPVEPVAAVAMFNGTVTNGDVVSSTVTVNEALPVLLCASVAEHVTVVVPIAKVEPETGEQVGVSVPSTVSTAEAVKLTVAPDELAASTVMFDGTVTVGDVVSSTETVNEELPVLLCASVAEHVTLVVPIAKTKPETGEQVGVNAPSTISVADAEKVTAAPVEPVAAVVMFDGTVTVGDVVSSTVTVNEALPVLLCASVAEHVTLVMPIAKVEPETSEQVGISEPSTVSIAEAVKLTVTPAALVASLKIFAGTAITGAIVSRTVTVKEALPVFPRASVAEQVTVVAPIAKIEPEAGEQIGVNTPLTVSVADDVKVTVAPAALVASLMIFAGTVTTGAVVSRTVIVKEALPVLPAVSVAEQVTVVVAIAKVEPEAGKQVGVNAPLTASRAEAV
jgi:hypothetical protein